MKYFRVTIVILALVLLSLPAQAEWEKVLDLNGDWAFTIGDNPNWASPSYNDSNWDRIRVPEKWEKQGFEGYDGFAWYRREFSTYELPEGRNLYLSLGEIDDADEVYINGKIIGASGSFPPKFSTAWNSQRWYLIPSELLRNGSRNVIAVRVYDEYREGGIIKGDIGIFVKKGLHSEFFDLQGLWDFRPSSKGDPCLGGGEAGWDQITVPGYWEHQGYEHYDGYACYRKKFVLSPEIAKKQMVLTLGLIDDMDVVYLNGVRIGSTGIREDGVIPDPGNSWAWKHFRSYFIPPNLLRAYQPNILTVQVYDHLGDGGIYEGPIGLIPAQQLTSFLKGIALE